ncbi:hypothetical protein M8J76_014802 [Diaphorina citri]|nr:hypothetical protein M8J76_014802 [Diaphorina citri]
MKTGTPSSDEQHARKPKSPGHQPLLKLLLTIILISIALIAIYDNHAQDQSKLPSQPEYSTKTHEYDTRLYDAKLFPKSREVGYPNINEYQAKYYDYGVGGHERVYDKNVNIDDAYIDIDYKVKDENLYDEYDGDSEKVHGGVGKTPGLGEELSRKVAFDELHNAGLSDKDQNIYDEYGDGKGVSDNFGELKKTGRDIGREYAEVDKIAQTEDNTRRNGEFDRNNGVNEKTGEYDDLEKIGVRRATKKYDVDGNARGLRKTADPYTESNDILQSASFERVNRFDNEKLDNKLKEEHNVNINNEANAQSRSTNTPNVYEKIDNIYDETEDDTKEKKSTRDFRIARGQENGRAKTLNISNKEDNEKTDKWDRQDSNSISSNVHDKISRRVFDRDSKVDDNENSVFHTGDTKSDTRNVQKDELGNDIKLDSNETVFVLEATNTINNNVNTYLPNEKVVLNSAVEDNSSPNKCNQGDSKITPAKHETTNQIMHTKNSSKQLESKQDRVNSIRELTPENNSSSDANKIISLFKYRSTTNGGISIENDKNDYQPNRKTDSNIDKHDEQVNRGIHSRNINNFNIFRYTNNINNTNTNPAQIQPSSNQIIHPSPNRVHYENQLEKNNLNLKSNKLYQPNRKAQSESKNPTEYNPSYKLQDYENQIEKHAMLEERSELELNHLNEKSEKESKTFSLFSYSSRTNSNNTKPIFQTSPNRIDYENQLESNPVNLEEPNELQAIHNRKNGSETPKNTHAFSLFSYKSRTNSNTNLRTQPSNNRILDPSQNLILNPSSNRILGPSPNRILEPSANRTLESFRRINAYGPVNPADLGDSRPHPRSRYFARAKRRLPQALIIGVRKCGTRALLEMLYLHPRIQKAAGEVHYFDRDENYARGLEWYRRQMPPSYAEQVTIEKSPSYFVTPEAPERIRAMNASIRLLVIVRDPVTRAISDYTQLKIHAAATSPGPVKRFEQLALRENGEINENYRPIAVFPKEQILIVNGDRLIEDPVPELQRIERFLNLEPHINHDNFYFNHTKGFYCLKDNSMERCLRESKGRKHVRVHPKVISKMRQYFNFHNQLFYDLVDENFDWPEE